MGGCGFSKEIFNAREQLITSDLMRAQALASRELQSVLLDASADDGGAPISGLSGPCSLTAASGFTMNLQAAQAFVYNPSDASLTADDSPYEVARWALQVLTFATPDGANPRIDLVVVTPATVSTDQQSRTVLVDPTTRAVTAQPVYKTANPTGTIAIVTGTPGATPAPPAVPGGAFALFEVWVPAAAPSAASFTAIPRMFRRAPFPWSSMSAIVDGFRLTWDLSADPSAASSAMSVSILGRNRIVIDGELIDAGILSLGVFQDAGANNPFAVAADANWNRPYYVYAVGGRHCPQAAVNAFGVPGPVALVESLVPPFAAGHPSSAITTPRGTTTQLGAVYVGLGMVAKGSTRRAACIMDDEWTWMGGYLGTGQILSITKTTNLAEAFPAQPAGHNVSFRTAAVVDFYHQASGGTSNLASLFPDDGTGAVSKQMALMQGGEAMVSGGIPGTATGRVPWPLGSTERLWITALTGDTAQIAVRAYAHRVRRLGVVTS